MGRIGIVVSNYNRSITENLLRGALATLVSSGIKEEDVEVTRVPGAWEVPLAASWLARRQGIQAVICLAAVIRGETSHDQHINRAVSTALMEISLKADLPVLFGVLTCNTVEQAIQRSGGDFGNKGSECATAALEMMALREKLRKGAE